MNARSLRILIGLTVVVIALAVVFQSSRTRKVRPQADGTKLFPELLASINDVATVHVKRNDGEYTLKRIGEGWGLVEKDGFDVDIEPVRKALIALADMTQLEAKTADPARYEQLGVQDPSTTGATSALVTLSTADGKELAQVVVGKSHQSKAGAPSGQLYVRKASEPQSWLVKTDLDLHEKSTDWLVKKILEVKRDRIRAVEVTHADGEVVRVARETSDVTDFTLANIPAGKELKYATIANTMSSTLEYLNLEDVARADTVDFTKTPGATCRFWCFDGLVITAQLTDVGEKTYARFTASYEAPPAAETPPAEPKAPDEAGAEKTSPEKPKAKSAEEVHAEVTSLNARLSKWAYVIPTYNKTTFAKHMSDLVKDPAPPPAAVPADDSGVGGEDKEDAYVIPGDLPPEIQEQIKEHQQSLGNKVITAPTPKPGADTPHEPGAEPPKQEPEPAPPH